MRAFAMRRTNGTCRARERALICNAPIQRGVSGCVCLKLVHANELFEKSHAIPAPSECNLN